MEYVLICNIDWKGCFVGNRPGYFVGDDGVVVDFLCQVP